MLNRVADDNLFMHTMAVDCNARLHKIATGMSSGSTELSLFGVCLPHLIFFNGSMSATLWLDDARRRLRVPGFFEAGHGLLDDRSRLVFSLFKPA